MKIPGILEFEVPTLAHELKHLEDTTEHPLVGVNILGELSGVEVQIEEVPEENNEECCKEEKECFKE